MLFTVFEYPCIFKKSVHLFVELKFVSFSTSLKWKEVHFASLKIYTTYITPIVLITLRLYIKFDFPCIVINHITKLKWIVLLSSYYMISVFGFGWILEVNCLYRQYYLHNLVYLSIQSWEYFIERLVFLFVVRVNLCINILAITVRTYTFWRYHRIY